MLLLHTNILLITLSRGDEKLSYAVNSQQDTPLYTAISTTTEKCKLLDFNDLRRPYIK